MKHARTHDELRQSEVWSEVREISRLFHKGVVDLFLRGHEGLTALTIEYGVF